MLYLPSMENLNLMNKKQNKKTPAKWGKISVNGMTNNRLTSRIYKQLMQLNIKNNKQLCF